MGGLRVRVDQSYGVGQGRLEHGGTGRGKAQAWSQAAEELVDLVRLLGWLCICFCPIRKKVQLKIAKILFLTYLDVRFSWRAMTDIFEIVRKAPCSLYLAHCRAYLAN